ncbi:PREDICTED: receptor activity-modifying protein 1 [Phaethon lepturus]|uniref:receptor activity-modifying protein 1 n=1 Tax=Phaethon lepturus TaxID=97097 RepID=UPI00053091C1|nr:PREDICTED: receptor activity-modifying protein 1 [Phaethon lepturus]
MMLQDQRGVKREINPEKEVLKKLVESHHFIAATACQEADYGWMIRHYCLKQFQLTMEGIGQRLWCDWDETVGTYGELTNCTALIAERLDCYWPNRLVDEFFVAVHKQYFRNCSPSGRALHDPPNSILCPFILLPVLVTLHSGNFIRR